MDDLTWLGHLHGLARCPRPDLVLVSCDGSQHLTWRLVLALYSPRMAELVLEACSPGDPGLVAVSVPAPGHQLAGLVASLETGDWIRESEVARLLGISGARLQLGDNGASSSKSRSLLKKPSTCLDSVMNNNCDIKEEIQEDSESEPDDFKMSLDDDDLAQLQTSARQLLAQKPFESWEPAKEKMFASSDFTLETLDLKQGLVFPDYQTMLASIQEWSMANFSPIVTRSSSKLTSRGSRGKTLRHIKMGCPHASNKPSCARAARARGRHSCLEILNLFDGYLVTLPDQS